MREFFADDITTFFNTCIVMIIHGVVSLDIASMLEVMAKDENFLTLMEEGGPFGGNLRRMLLRRVE